MANYNELSERLVEKIKEDMDKGYKNPYAAMMRLSLEDTLTTIFPSCGEALIYVIQKKSYIVRTTTDMQTKHRYSPSMKMMILAEEHCMYNWFPE